MSCATCNILMRLCDEHKEPVHTVTVTPLLPDRDWVGIFKEIADKIREAADVARKHECDGTGAWLDRMADNMEDPKELSDVSIQ